MKNKIVFIICFLMISQGIQSQMLEPNYKDTKGDETITEFETASEAVRNMKIGWNLSNTLESVTEDDQFKPEGWWSWETLWGNPVTKPELLKIMRKAGFGAIRVPVTWFPHLDANNHIDTAWMKRVHEVVDYVIDQGMYCILNTHHDNGAWIVADGENYERYHERFEAIWRQVAEEFQEYDEHLVFEAYNEVLDRYGSWIAPNGDHGQEHIEQAYKAINDWAQSFVNVVRSTGGNNQYRNLLVNIYSSLPGVDEWTAVGMKQMKVPQDVTSNHIIFGIHPYWMDNNSHVDGIMNNIKTHFTSQGIPTIASEWGAWDGFNTHPEAFHAYFVQQAKANDVATFLWGGGCEGRSREIPVFEDPEGTTAILKAYYGDRYEPKLQTLDDYDFQGIQVSYDYLWAEMRLTDYEFDLSEYKGIRVELDNADDKLSLKVYGETDGKEQNCMMSSATETLMFDSSLLGGKVRFVTLQNFKDGQNETRILNTYLINKDGTETVIHLNWYSVYHGCEYEFVLQRKQFVHTVAYDGLWSEFNLFCDDIPLKLKNYKGIRIELAEKPQNVQVKVYGDWEQKEDYLSLTDVSATILFNTDIFSTEINRITLQHTKDGNGEVKVVGAWLIRQDGTEEYSELSPYWGCKITNVERYATGINHVTNDKMPCNSNIYNLAGQRLSKPQKGINIIAGKKIVVR